MSRGPDEVQIDLMRNISFNIKAYDASSSDVPKKLQYLENVRHRLHLIETQFQGNLPGDIVDAKLWLSDQDKLKELSGYESDGSFDPDDMDNDKTHEVINTDQVNEETSWDPEVSEEKSWDPEIEIQNPPEVVEDNGYKSFDASETSDDPDLYPYTDLRKGADKNRKVSGFYIYVKPKELRKIDLSILLTPI
jgi:hypothetical protein